MITDPRDRVVALTADDLTAILEAVVLAAKAGIKAHYSSPQDDYRRLSGIVLELSCKFDLPEIEL